MSRHSWGRLTCTLLQWESYIKLIDVEANFGYTRRRVHGLYYGLALLSAHGVGTSHVRGMIVDDFYVGQHLTIDSNHDIPMPKDVMGYWHAYFEFMKKNGTDVVLTERPLFRKYGPVLRSICGEAVSYYNILQTRLAHEVIKEIPDWVIIRQYGVDWRFLSEVKKCLVEKYMRRSILPPQRRQSLHYQSTLPVSRPLDTP